MNSNYPWFTNQYKIADSEIERLSATDQRSVDESDEQESSTTITTISQKEESEDQSEQKPSEQLQMISDDYPWYSSYYTITDADSQMSQLYKNLSYTIEQLQQRPPPATVEFQPEPHEKVITPDYDRQALADTKETREKVHELAKLSTILTSTTTSTTDASQSEPDKDEDGFQVVKRGKRVPSSTIDEKTPLATTITTTTASDKKKPKKKKDKTETTLADARIPLISDIHEQKSDDVQLPEGEERIKTTESEQKVTDTKSEEQKSKPLSTSILSDIDESKPIDDEKNDSTSSDASQWLSSSLTSVPEGNKVDTQKTTEQTQVIETTTTSSSTDHELTQPEVLSTSSPSTKKKKTKQQSIDQNSQKKSEILSSPVAIEEPKIQPKPVPPTPIKTSTSTVHSKVVSQPEDEDLEDDEGFQVVRYRKNIPSVTGSEKTPFSSPLTITSKQRISSDIDSKPTVTQERPGSSTRVVTPVTTIVTETTTTKKKPKQDKKETIWFDAPVSSPSTDTDIISSSNIDDSKVKHIEQQATDQPIKSSDTIEPKSTSSTVLPSSTGPSQTKEQKTKKQPKTRETSLQSQISSSSLSAIDETRAEFKPTLPPPIKSSSTVSLREAASTSPDEEEEDNEGFRVVRYRKRISSAPRADKTLPPLPTRTSSFKQNLGRHIDIKPIVIQGRHGSGSRSAPRTPPGSQSSLNKQQQMRPKQDRPQILPFSAPQSPALKETRTMPSFGVENKKIEQTKPSVIDTRQKMSDTTQQIGESQSAIVVEQQRPIGIERQTSSSIVQSKSPEQIQQQEKIEPITRQSSTNVTSTVNESIQPIVPDYHAPTKDKIKTTVPPISMKETIPSTITTISTTETRKTPLIEEDDDGFRVVRYRKHIPSSVPTTPTAIPKQQSFGSDTDKRSTNVLKKTKFIFNTCFRNYNFEEKTR